MSTSRTIKATPDWFQQACKIAARDGDLDFNPADFGVEFHLAEEYRSGRFTCVTLEATFALTAANAHRNVTGVGFSARRHHDKNNDLTAFEVALNKAIEDVLYKVKRLLDLSQQPLIRIEQLSELAGNGFSLE